MSKELNASVAGTTPKVKKRFKMGTLLGTIACVLLGTIIALNIGGLTNAYQATTSTLAIQRVGMPTFIHNQELLANVEMLDRMAQIVFVSGDPMVRSRAAQQAEDFTTNNTSLAPATLADTQHISKLIRRQNMMRDSIDMQRRQVKQTVNDYAMAIQALIKLSNHSENTQALLNALISSISYAQDINSSPRAFTTGIKRTIFTEELEQIQKTSTNLIKLSPNHKVVIENHLKVITNSFEQYARLQQQLEEDHADSLILQSSLNNSIGSLRNQVGSNIQYELTMMLQDVHIAASNYTTYTTVIFCVTAVCFLLFFLTVHFAFVRPLGWASTTLANIKQGRLDSIAPLKTRIAELNDISTLLEEFCTHLAHVSTHTDQLELDVAQKEELEEVMEAVFKASMDGYIIWNTDQLFVVSPELLTFFGATSTQQVSDDYILFGFSSRQNRAKEYARIKHAGKLRERHSFRRITGEELPCEITHITLKNDKVLTYVRDRRNQNRIEAALTLAKNQAETAVQVKTDFLARISHEIRTPMNGILGLTHIALTKNPPQEIRLYLEKINDAANALLKVINDMLNFSSLERGKLILDSICFSPSELLRSIDTLIAGELINKNVTFTIRCENELPKVVHGDAVRLGQVLFKLCDNAVKFTEAGFITLQVKVTELTIEQCTILFEVHDTGIGISPEHLEAIFQPFTQEANYSTRKYGGTGLGLIIAKSYVHMMGGELTVKSTPRVGSTFSFAVPFSIAKAARFTPEAITPDIIANANFSSFAIEEIENSKPHAVEPIPFSPSEDENGHTEAALLNKVILLVEDVEINQEVASEVLTSFGCKVVVANNGQEALNILETTPVDLVLMDIQMPIMDGLTATQHIRNHPRHAIKNLPVIAMTAHALPEDKQKSLVAGMNNHIVKPINIEVLRDTLLRYLK